MRVVLQIERGLLDAFKEHSEGLHAVSAFHRKQGNKAIATAVQQAADASNSL